MPKHGIGSKRSGRYKTAVRFGGFTMVLAIVILLVIGMTVVSHGATKGNGGVKQTSPGVYRSSDVIGVTTNSPTTKTVAVDPDVTTATSAPTATPAAAATVSSQIAPTASSDIFTAGDVRFDDTSYQSGDLSVTITNGNEDGVNYYVADCVMKDSNRFFAAFALDRYVLHKGERSSVIARRKGAVIAINGDYYGHADADRDDKGIVLRNGVLYRQSPWHDIAVIYQDGTMKTFDNTMGADQLVAEGANQIFSFGPMLMDDKGKALSAAQLKKRHNANSPLNPRSGIGYIGPNHFVLVVVDGRGAGGSRGMTISEFANLFESLGCKNAYNLDGGGSATMVFMGKVINHPCDSSGERQVSDIVYFGETETDRANIDRFQ